MSSLEQRIARSNVFLEPKKLAQMLESARGSGKFSGISALVVDATERSGAWDIFRLFQRSVLHLGAVSVATLLHTAGCKDVKAVYEVLTPDFDYSEENPDIVGISAIVTNVPFANKKMEYFRETNQDALIVAGGSGYAFNPHVALKHGADAVVIGKAEYPLLILLERVVEQKKQRESLKSAFDRIYTEDIEGIYTRHKEAIDFAPMVRDLDELPFINFDLIQGKQSKRMRSLLDSEGCVHNCDFCSTVKLNRNRYRMKSTERIVEEMRRAKKNGMSDVFFVGDHAFARGYEKIVELTDAIQKADLGIGWIAQTTIDSIDKNLEKGIIKALEKSRCHQLCIGIESINDADLHSSNASAKNSYEKTNRVLEALEDSPVEVHAMLIIKPFVEENMQVILPYSAPNTPEGITHLREEVIHTVDFLKRYKVRSAQFHSAIPLPGTKSADDFFRAGIVLKQVGGRLVDWSKYTGQYVVASANPFQSHQIMEDAYKRFYSPRYIAGSLFCQRGIEKMLYRAVGRAITFVYCHGKEVKRYVDALAKGDFGFYNAGERFKC